MHNTDFSAENCHVDKFRFHEKVYLKPLSVCYESHIWCFGRVKKFDLSKSWVDEKKYLAWSIKSSLNRPFDDFNDHFSFFHCAQNKIQLKFFSFWRCSEISEHFLKNALDGLFNRFFKTQICFKFDSFPNW